MDEGGGWPTLKKSVSLGCAKAVLEGLFFACDKAL
jgi:hypothetical protein